MKKTGLLLVIIQVIFLGQLKATDLDLSPAKWIWYPSERTLQNTFILFRKEINIDKDKSVQRDGLLQTAATSCL